MSRSEIRSSRLMVNFVGAFALLSLTTFFVLDNHAADPAQSFSSLSQSDIDMIAAVKAKMKAAHQPPH